MKQKEKLYISGTKTDKGIRIRVLDKSYNIEFPSPIWENTEPQMQQFLVENMTLAETHFLPLMLEKQTIVYNTPQPFLESFFFRNQLYDLQYCALADKVDQLEYMRDFYNLAYEFSPKPATLPVFSKPYPKKKGKPIALVPFTFGKECLVTLGLALELGIEPVLIYLQEPAHPYEEKYKLKKLKELSSLLHIDTHFIKHEPGLFRYGKAFGLKNETELGWAGQTTLLTLLMLPFAWHYGASYMLYGSEYSNNDIDPVNGWDVFYSFDQTHFWTQAQNNIIRLATKENCEVKSLLEPLEELAIFSTLHTRYPELGKLQFSCHGKDKLYNSSSWCHKCYKCGRTYLMALATGIDPASIGFEKDVLKEKNILEHYFAGAPEYERDLDYAFYMLAKKFPLHPLTKTFKKRMAPKLRPEKWYKKHFTTLQILDDLPEKYAKKLISIYKKQLQVFEKSML